MKIAIECSELLHRHRTGISNYVLAIREALSELGTNSTRDEILSCYKWSRALRMRHDPSQTQQLRWHIASRVLDPTGIDITHAPNAIALKAGNAKRVLTIHDVAIFLPELQAIPAYTALNLVPEAKTRMQQLIDQADALACVSHQSAEDVQRVFQTGSKLIRVCKPAPFIKVVQPTADIIESDALFLRQQGLRSKNFLLFVGSIGVRKNIPNLIEAYAQSGLAQQMPLVLAGAPSMGMEFVHAAINKHQLHQQVRVFGYTDDQSIARLYRHASALCFVSYYEGFGIPILEAMLADCPVLCSSLGAAPETAGGHATLCDPFSISDISSGLHSVLATTSFQIAAAHEYAASFEWSESAQQLRRLYLDVLDDNAGVSKSVIGRP